MSVKSSGCSFEWFPPPLPTILFLYSILRTVLEISTYSCVCAIYKLFLIIFMGIPDLFQHWNAHFPVLWCSVCTFFWIPRRKHTCVSSFGYDLVASIVTMIYCTMGMPLPVNNIMKFHGVAAAFRCLWLECNCGYGERRTGITNAQLFNDRI